MYISVDYIKLRKSILMLKKELIELCLLHLLYIKDAHGYELIHYIYGVIPDIQESTVYALLRNLSKITFDSTVFLVLCRAV